MDLFFKGNALIDSYQKDGKDLTVALITVFRGKVSYKNYGFIIVLKVAVCRDSLKG